jgi:hypothetical protein
MNKINYFLINNFIFEIKSSLQLEFVYILFFELFHKETKILNT